MDTLRRSMSDSASTPRLRITFAIYIALIAATALIGPRASPPAVQHAMGAVGFLAVTLACLGRLWCSVFIAGRKDATLVTTGPYARCRHPLYACSMVGALGLGLASRSWLLCMAVVFLVSALVIYAAFSEEQFLADAFPEQFRAYVQATPHRWWPGPAVAMPEELRVQPRVYFKAFLDAASFFLLWLLVTLAAQFPLSH